mmetsp:Transcript_30694/g.98741  ORF Transcript_30694/g.98741 Transcript_30694/m.98741 type:complete len:209 (-) Transcript_30694:230-856(-)
MGSKAKSSLDGFKLASSSITSPTTGIMLSIPPPNWPAKALLKHMCHDHRSSCALKSLPGHSLGNSCTISAHTFFCFFTLAMIDSHLSSSRSSSSHSHGKFCTWSTSGRSRMYPQIALLLPFLCSIKSFNPSRTYHLSYRFQNSSNLSSGQGSLPLTHKTASRGSRTIVSSSCISFLATIPLTSPCFLGMKACSRSAALTFFSIIQSST